MHNKSEQENRTGDQIGRAVRRELSAGGLLRHFEQEVLPEWPDSLVGLASIVLNFLDNFIDIYDPIEYLNTIVLALGQSYLELYKSNSVHNAIVMPYFDGEVVVSAKTYVPGTPLKKLWWRIEVQRAEKEVKIPPSTRELIPVVARAGVILNFDRQLQQATEKCKQRLIKREVED